MKSILILSLCVILLLQCTSAQRTRQQGRRPASGGSRGSGGPSGIRFPTDDESGYGIGRFDVVGSGGLRAGKWPGGFYGGSNW